MNFLNYTIEQLIGEGGMAKVYLAVNNQTGEQIAIKILNKEFCYNKNIRGRFVDEARKMVQLSHRNIVQFIELIEEDDNVAIVMEYVSGTTLRDILTNKRLNDAEIKRYLTQIISALGYLHQAGFIHRDIKPSNFIINERGTLKLTDFGISKDTTGKLDEHTQTSTSASMGTPMYMSPEQIRSTKDITYLSDIYSLGVILWEMASGKKPYNTNTLSTFDLQLKIVQEKLPLTGTTWDGLIQKATKKTEEERLQKLEDFLSIEKYIVDDDKKVIHDDRTIIVEIPIAGKINQTIQKQDAKENTNSSSIETKKKKTIGFWIGISIGIIVFIGLIIYFSSGEKNNNNEKLATEIHTLDSTKIEQEEIPLYNVHNNPIVQDSAYLYLNNEGRKFYRVQNSILFWTFEDNRIWSAKKEMILYKEPYSDEIVEKIKANNRIIGLDVEYHYYENSKVKITKMHKSTFDNCPDGSVNLGDTILLLNAEGECYWNVINKGKFTGVHFSDEGRKLAKSLYDGCNMIEGARLTTSEDYIVWVKVQAPSRKIGWLKFSNMKGNNFFDKVKVEDEGNVEEVESTFSGKNYIASTVPTKMTKTSSYGETELLSVENTDSYTVVKFKEIFLNAGNWMSLDSDTYIYDKQNNRRLYLKDAYNITISPQVTKSGYNNHTIYWEAYFPRVQSNCKSIDFIEPNSAWQFYDVSISNTSYTTDYTVNGRISSGGAKAKLKTYYEEQNKKEIVIKNNSSVKEIFVSVIFYNGETWVTEGWYKVASGKSITLPLPSKTGSTFYYHAAGGGYTWTSGADSKKYCVDPKNAFTFYDNKTKPCKETRSFVEKMVTGKTTTITLSD